MPSQGTDVPTPWGTSAETLPPRGPGGGGRAALRMLPRLLGEESIGPAQQRRAPAAPGTSSEEPFRGRLHLDEVELGSRAGVKASHRAASSQVRGLYGKARGLEGSPRLPSEKHWDRSPRTSPLTALGLITEGLCCQK